MEKHFLFCSPSSFDRIAFEDQLLQIGIESNQITYFSSTSGEFIAEADLYAKLEPLLIVMRDDLGVSLSFLIAHENSALEAKLLKESASYFPGRAMFPTDLLLREMTFGDFSSYPFMKAKFENVPHDLLLTAGTYLRCGCDECLSAKSLFVHRNTFLYRLNKFIELTNLDIRDYHNALLLELYFQISAIYHS